MAEIVPPRTRAARVGIRTAEVETDVKLAISIRLDVGDRSTETIVFGSIGHVDSCFSGGEEVRKRALSAGCDFHHAVRPGSPGIGGWGLDRLHFEITVETGQVLKLPGKSDGIETVRCSRQRGWFGRNCGDRIFVDTEVVKFDRGNIRTGNTRRIEHHEIDDALPFRRDWQSGDCGYVARRANLSRDGSAGVIEGQLQVLPLIGRDGSDPMQSLSRPQRYRLGRDDHFDGRRRLDRTEPDPVRSGRTGIRCRDAEIEIEMNQISVVVEATRINRLRDPIAADTARNADTDFAARITILEGALCPVRDSDFPFVQPGRDEDSIATPSGRGLQLEVTIEIIQRSQDGRCDWLFLFFQAGGDGGDFAIEFSPL